MNRCATVIYSRSGFGALSYERSDQTAPRGRRGFWSDEFVTLIILRELHERRSRGEAAATVHHLSTLRGMPTQRDQRIRRLLENLQGQGLVSKVAIGELTGFQVNDAGERWWVVHQSVLGLFRSIRDEDANP